MSSISRGTYLYCIARAEPFSGGMPPLRSGGVSSQGGPPRVLRRGDLAAIVSDAPAARLDISRPALLAHEQVIAEVLQRSDVLPVQFGTVAESDLAISELLLGREAAALRRQLQRVQGCLEFSLKVFWERERLFAEIAARDAEIRELRDDLAGQQASEAIYFQQIQMGELVADAIERMRSWESAQLLAALRPLAREVRNALPVTDMMALNAALLVPRDATAVLGERVAWLEGTQRGRLIFRYSGPLAPYSFVDLVTNWKETRHGVAH